LADVRPFHGVHYNPARVKDLAKVICPPYDVISPQEQQELYQRSDFNFVRVEYGRELPNDKGTDNKYTRAAVFLAQWLEQQVLVADKAPAIYINEHEFPHRDKTCRRREINCLVRLEDWDKNIVRPHEGTLSRPKSDRLNLLWALQADTSPIMALFEDRDGGISRALEARTSCRPLLTAGAGNGESQRLWAINDENSVAQICRSLAGQPIYIADGHHRYESALAYQRERRTCEKPAPEDQTYDFVMMTLVDFEDPGLVILPAHRLVRGLAQSSLDSLTDFLELVFGVKELPAKAASGPGQIDKWLSEDKDEVKLLLYGPGRENLYRLTLRDLDLIRPMMPYFHSELYQRLDVSIVDHVILEELLGLTHEAAGVYIDYTNDAQEAIKRVREREYQLALIVNPVKPGAIKAIADAGDRMPRKSTYFYPKVPAGLVLYKF
jgi:uncharacterized protein (DUF1015 family)